LKIVRKEIAASFHFYVDMRRQSEKANHFGEDIRPTVFFVAGWNYNL
jgi:hypothetical protein